MNLPSRRQDAVKTARAALRAVHGAETMFTALPLALSSPDAVGLGAALLLLGYLVYALVRAERF